MFPPVSSVSVHDMETSPMSREIGIIFIFIFCQKNLIACGKCLIFVLFLPQVDTK